MEAIYGTERPRTTTSRQMALATWLYNRLDRNCARGRLGGAFCGRAGVGDLIAAAMSKGAKTVMIGLGGSATNDAGCGMAATQGFRFLDADGKKLEPVIAIVGSTSPSAGEAMFDAVFPIVRSSCDAEAAMRDAAKLLERTTAEAAQSVKLDKLGLATSGNSQ
jgi:glycerate kinase